VCERETERRGGREREVEIESERGGDDTGKVTSRDLTD